MRIQAFLCLSASLLLAGTAAAQQPSFHSTPPKPASSPVRQPPSMHKPAKDAAQQVILAVTVRDKHGKLVPGLTASDFTLTQDGRAQTIQSFSQQTDQPHFLGIMVDTSEPVMPAMSLEGKAAQQFVAAMLPADPKQTSTKDQAFVLHFDNEVELLRDFTNSQKKLDAELAHLEPTTAQPMRDQGPETTDNSGEWNRPKPAHGGTQIFDAIYLASKQLMQKKQGLKTLVVFSDGVDRSSKETQSEAIDAAERAGTQVYTIYFRGGSLKRSDFPGMGRRPGGYPGGGPGGYPGGPGGYPGGPGGPGGYPGGGYPGGPGYPGQQPGGKTAEAPIDGKKVMQDIAQRTGGQFYDAKRASSFGEIYDQVAKDLHSQYILAYTPDQSDDEGGYHKVVLKPKNKDLHVIMREGYYAPGGNN
ncbi:MAG: VWA domain-containing protein [Acidobacteriota bacterium]